MYKYSETTDYIYLSELNYQNLPSDLVNITKEEVDIYLGNNIPSGKRRVKNSYPFVLEDIPQPSVEEIILAKSKEEHAWVTSELNNIQVELMYHWTDDQRATSTLDAWKLYARQLRDYTTIDENGVPSICGESRPVRP
ncbi:TPA: hypothetical protein ACOAY7_002975 [Vibrio cholerae]